MTRRTRSLAVPSLLFVVLTVLVGVALAGPATAGGPTSVLLVAPGDGRTASLYNGSADYAELTRLVDAYGSGTGATDPPPGVDPEAPGGASNPDVTVTWLVHDVQVWRVDRVRPGAEGGALISTQSDVGAGGDIWDAPTRWHRSPDSAALVALLDRLGVGPSGATAAASGSDPSVADRAAATAPADAAAGVSARAGTDAAPSGRPTTTVATTGALAGLAGLLVGAALTLAATRRRRAGDRAGSDAPAGTEVLVGPGG